MLQYRCLILYVCALLLFYCSSFRADTLGPTASIANGGNTVGAPPYSCFNTQTNQFFVGWISGSIYYSLYSPNSNLLSDPVLLVSNSSGPVNPFTMPISCYNAVRNEFLISYLGQSDVVRAWFNILDQNGSSIIGPIGLENLDGDQANSLVLCCYNSINNQYVLTWASVAGLGYFAVVDGLGNIVVPTTEIAGSAVNANGGYNISVSYNSINNHYFFTWQGANDGNPYFAIYNANGTVNKAATLIPSVSSINAAIVSSSFNSSDNQYLIAWNDIFNRGYFTIYDGSGAPVKEATLFSDAVSFYNYGSVNTSYNSQNNEYFLTWEGIEGNSQCAIYSGSGSVIVSPMLIPNLPGVSDFGFVTNSYSVNDNAFFISWIGLASTQDGYYAVYRRTPPPPIKVDRPRRFRGVLSHKTSPIKLRATWRASTSSNVREYQIFKGHKHIDTIQADARRLFKKRLHPTSFYKHHLSLYKRKLNHKYKIRAVDSSGNTSSFSHLRFK